MVHLSQRLVLMSSFCNLRTPEVVHCQLSQNDQRSMVPHDICFFTLLFVSFNGFQMAKNRLLQYQLSDLSREVMLLSTTMGPVAKKLGDVAIGKASEGRIFIVYITAVNLFCSLLLRCESGIETFDCIRHLGQAAQRAQRHTRLATSGDTPRINPSLDAMDSLDPELWSLPEEWPSRSVSKAETPVVQPRTESMETALSMMSPGLSTEVDDDLLRGVSLDVCLGAWGKHWAKPTMSLDEMTFFLKNVHSGLRIFKPKVSKNAPGIYMYMYIYIYICV